MEGILKIKKIKNYYKSNGTVIEIIKNENYNPCKKML
jgi:hypothetical protein